MDAIRQGSGYEIQVPIDAVGVPDELRTLHKKLAFRFTSVPALQNVQDNLVTLITSIQDLTTSKNKINPNTLADITRLLQGMHMPSELFGVLHDLENLNQDLDTVIGAPLTNEQKAQIKAIGNLTGAMPKTFEETMERFYRTEGLSPADVIALSPEDKAEYMQEALENLLDGMEDLNKRAEGLNPNQP